MVVKTLAACVLAAVAYFRWQDYRTPFCLSCRGMEGHHHETGGYVTCEPCGGTGYKPGRKP